MALDKVTKSFITVLSLAFAIVTFFVFFGGYTYELKWHLSHLFNSVFPQKEQSVQQEKKVEQKEVDFRPYMSEVQKHIRKNWNPLIKDVPAVVVTEFDVLKNGEIQNPKIKQSSGNPNTDNAALEAIKKSSPFPPLPLQYTNDKVHIEFNFDINVHK